MPQDPGASILNAALPRYAELHCKTNFSFLQGASHAEELAAVAAGHGYAALAVTDVNTLAGIVRAHVAAKEAGVKLLVGAEIVPEDAPPILLYSPDLKGYAALASLITRGRRAAEKGECSLLAADVFETADRLLAAVVLSPSDPDDANLCHLQRYREAFGERCHLAVALHRGPDDVAALKRYRDLSERVRVPLVASNDVHYHTPARRMLHDVLTAVRHGVTVADLGERRFPNGERYLKPPAEMAALFQAYPQAIAQAVELADRCTFSLDELRYEYPEELCPPGLTPAQHLTNLTWAGAKARYPAGVPEKVASLLHRELALIEDLRYEAFFLTVWDIVQFARQRGILCQGRGSAANSAVCFCLAITSVDPDRSDMLFERFISRERNEPPDIDVDFEHERREEVFQYIYRKYGRDRAGLAAEVITYRPRSAIRDVGKALGLSLDCVDRLAKAVDMYDDKVDLAGRAREAGLDPRALGVSHLMHLAQEILGFPRHLSQHVGGFVITRGPLSELVPIENAAMPDRTVIQWDKDDLDALGILKVDCLALGMLTAIHKAFDLIERHHGRALTLATVPSEDEATYDMCCKADTVGVFQIESRAQMAMLPRLRPRCFYDLVVEVAIVRPGPIKGGLVHPYLRRRNGEEKAEYPDPIIEQVLGKTLGVPIFQEQVLRLAMVAAGFTGGEAEQLRRAMGAWRRPGILEQFRVRLRDGIVARGLPAAFADQIFEQIKGFGEYGFPEAHAASFALLAYVSAWLKCHYPAAFATALLNSQPMGFYAPAQIVRDAREHGVEVRPIDVNASAWDCTLEDAFLSGPANVVDSLRESNGTRGASVPLSPANVVDSLRELNGTRGASALHCSMRLGYRLIRGFPESAAASIAAARVDGEFRSIAHFARRTGLGRALLARLAGADAFNSLGLTRRSALWHVLAVEDDAMPLFAGIEEPEMPPPGLPDMSPECEVEADYDSIGLSLKAHPFSFIRPDLAALETVPTGELANLPDQTPVRIAGLVLVRQRPSTAKGTIFITLEDETGVANLVIWPRTWQRFRREVHQSIAILAEGKVERAGDVIHVMPTRLEDLSGALRRLAVKSRDFR